MVNPDLNDQYLSRLQRDDETALRALFDAYFDRLASVACHIVRDADEAKDIAQTVFIKLWHKRHSLEVRTALYPYLRRMAINEALAAERTKTRRSAHLESSDFTTEPVDSSDPAIVGELKDNISRAIDQLPRQSATVFRLSRFEDLSNKEIARELNISVKTVENHMTRALSQLRKALAGYLQFLW